MKCIICGEWIEPDEPSWSNGEEAMHHECCNLIEKGFSLTRLCSMRIWEWFDSKVSLILGASLSSLFQFTRHLCKSRSFICMFLFRYGNEIMEPTHPRIRDWGFVLFFLLDEFLGVRGGITLWDIVARWLCVRSECTLRFCGSFLVLLTLGVVPDRRFVL